MSLPQFGWATVELDKALNGTFVRLNSRAIAANPPAPRPTEANRARWQWCTAMFRRPVFHPTHQTVSHWVRPVVPFASERGGKASTFVSIVWVHATMGIEQND